MVAQVATPERAFLFDLLALHSADVLDDCLIRLFTSPQPLKLGCGLSGDLRQLASGYPDMQAFKHAAGIVELRYAHGSCMCI